MRDKVTSSGARHEHTPAGRPDLPPARIGQINQINPINPINLGEPPA